MTDIAKLLKEAPYGMELYSTLFGNVYLKGVSDNDNISVYDKNKVVRYFNKYGQFFEDFPEADCQLFPAKEQSWEDYNRIVNLLTTGSSLNPYKFKVGDWIIRNDGCSYVPVQIYNIKKDRYLVTNMLGSKGKVMLTYQDKWHLWTINDAKPGDILNANGAVFIYKKHNKDYVYHYCGINLGDEFVIGEDDSIWNANNKIYPATHEQKDLLFNKINEAGYTWDPYSNTLTKKTKFKIGDWIICKEKDRAYDRVYQITDIKDDIYFYDNTTKYDYINVADKIYELWNINDAKPGDVLVDTLSGTHTLTILFKCINEDDSISANCGWNGHTFRVTIDGLGYGTLSSTRYVPATQEQRNLLFKEIENAGYIWDSLDKKLSKKTKFKVDEWISDGTHRYKITNIDDTYYWNSPFCIIGTIGSVDNKYHLWTIDDAKPGDIVVYEGEISIFKNNIKNSKENSFGGFAYYYCWDGKTFFTDNFYSLTEDDKCNIHLATLEESELIHSQLTNSGYEWDLDKKVLSKKAKFKIGDWVVNNKDKSVSQITETICDEKDPNTLYGYVHTNGFFANSFENVYHLWTIKDAKDGDILSAKIDGDDYILLFKRIKDGWIETYGHYYITIDKFCVPSQLFCRDYQGTLYPATQKERYLLFKKMREAGYQWYAGKKDLKKIQSHYDIANFYAGMPVLVRADNNCKWDYSVFSRITGNKDWQFAVCNGVSFTQCIPFNKKTKYLLGTTDMCPEEYINW